MATLRKIRRDSKHRLLRAGESIRADGKYQFKYYVGDKAKFVYSWRLEPTDKLPAGKKATPSLRELEKQIGRDIESQLDPQKLNLTVVEITKRYLSTKTGSRPSTVANYNFVMNILKTRNSAQKRFRTSKPQTLSCF